MIISNALSQLDTRWKLQQRQERQEGAQSNPWTELWINDEEAENVGTDSNAKDGTSTDIRPNKKKVYLLSPPTLPSSIIVFVGGAGIGYIPHVTYGEFLTRVSHRLNAAVLAIPYQIGTLDHFGLSKQVGELARKALLQLEDDAQFVGYSRDLPTFGLAHSLGCKLLALYIAATDLDLDRLGFVSFNNFGFSKTISMVKDFAQALTASMGKGPTATDGSGGFGQFASDASTQQILNQVFDFAESAISTIGIEFSPVSALPFLLT